MTVKINWNKAPEWANYVVQHEYGFWMWFENEPVVVEDGGFGYSWRNQGMGKNKYYKVTACVEDWKKSLQERPVKSGGKSEMIDKKAVLDCLCKYQSWRKGETDDTMDELGLDPAKISWAIDCAIKLIKQGGLGNG